MFDLNVGNVQLLLEYIPQSFRSSWPFKRYYWQQDEIDKIRVEAERLRKLFNDNNEKEAYKSTEEGSTALIGWDETEEGCKCSFCFGDNDPELEEDT